MRELHEHCTMYTAHVINKQKIEREKLQLLSELFGSAVICVCLAGQLATAGSSCYLACLGDRQQIIAVRRKSSLENWILQKIT